MRKSKEAPAQTWAYSNVNRSLPRTENQKSQRPMLPPSSCLPSGPPQPRSGPVLVLFFQIREPPTRGDPKPRPRWKGLRNWCGVQKPLPHTPPQGRPRSERTREGQHDLTNVLISQSKRRTSSGVGASPPLPSVTSQGSA